MNTKLPPPSFNTGTNEYNIEHLEYPNDLHDESIYNGNKVLIFINAHKSSKFLPSGEYTIDMDKLDTPRIASSVVGRNLGNFGTIAAGMAPTAIASILAGNLLGASAKAIAVGTGVTAATGVSLAASENISGTTTREMKRLKTAIALHVPNNLNIRYTAKWSDEDLSMADMAGAAGEGLNKAVNEFNAADFMKAPGSAIASALDKMAPGAANLALTKAPGGSYLSAKTGLAPNPKKEMLFKTVDFRTFSFDYVFAPRDETEATNVMQIIKTLKFHMHPEYKDNNSFLYLYPSEFDVQYYTGDGINRYIHQHTSCVLTEFSVNYTPHGSFTTFPNGMPTHISVTMSFQELVAPTKESIGAPYMPGGL